MVKTRCASITAVIVGLLCLLPAATLATTFVLMDEPSLLRTSDVVLLGTVTAIESAALRPDGAIYTYVHVQPNRVFKGSVRRERIALREPGGAVGERGEWIFGAPEFWVGERSLLFLTRNADGTLQTNNLSMGKFAVSVDSVGRTMAARDFGWGASVYIPATGQVMEALPETQPLAPLVKRLRTMAVHEPAGVLLPLTMMPPELNTAPTEVHESFTFLGFPPARWFEPDSGLPVNYLIDSNGDNKLGFAASKAAVDAGIAAWTGVPTSNLVLADAGTIAPTKFSGCGTSRILFNDPFNEVTNPTACSGILAIGGYCTTTGSKVVNGTTFGRIATGKVMFNNGWGGCSFWNQCNVGEVATHEFGHTIGLGHSADSSATMAAIAHFDGRCASLRKDDVAAATFVYPEAGVVFPTSTRSSTPTRTGTSTPKGTATPTPTSTPAAAPPTSTVATATPTITRTAVPTQTSAPTPTSGGTPPNNACSSPTIISTTPYTNTIFTVLASYATNDPFPSCGSHSRGKSVWYRFRAPTAGTITADTFGSSYDTILSAYTGFCGAMTEVSGACSDNANATTQSQISFTATSGQTYSFMVSAPNFDGGTLVFHLTFS